MRSIHLSTRLQTAVDMLPKCQAVADIGCDHGRVSIALLQQGKCDSVIAIDISEPSLCKARRLADFVGVSDRIDTRVGDGFSLIEDGECQAALILGMGGQVISHILEQASERLKGNTYLVMQPMRGQDDLRRYLWEHNYTIVDERVVKEGRRIYQLLSAVGGDERQRLPDGWCKDFFEVGFLPSLRKNKVYHELLKRLEAQYTKQLIEAMNSDGEENIRTRLNNVIDIQELMEEHE
ncbi:MAG: class I SAM-dependent methyltransferase [Eubacteriales bacterium]|nr:class I SAM-dependent methyltransferase [Eubacteriales bacterium]